MIKHVLAGLMLTGMAAFSQEIDYGRMIQDPAIPLSQKQEAFRNYWKGKDYKEKGKGWKPFKRWEYMMKHRADANGMMADPTIVFTEWKKAHAQFETQRSGNSSTQAASQWQYIGPSNGVPNNTGAGRLCFIVFDPVTPTTMWVGSPAGGLWKSTNSGANWSVVNDHLANLGAAHLAIDPTNTQVMYLSTGDRDASDTYSIGLLKSTDGGITWNTTGLSYNVNQLRHVNCVLIDHTNTQVLYAATSLGIFKSTDAGVNWTSVKAGSFEDLKFKPGDHNTIYACGNSFARTTDAGLTWSNGSFPSPNSNSIGRVAVAVTPADSNIVYVLGGQGASANYGFAGFYKSTNSGVSFTKMCSSPNLMGWNPSGTDAGGQAWYDLIVAANPTNANEVICGGVNTWRSTNGGTSFSLFTHWYGGGGKPYVHADVHAIEYSPVVSSTIFIGCDGGLFSSTNSGTNWAITSNGLQIGEIYRLGVSQTNQDLTLTGWQDDGTSLTNQGTSTTGLVLGGDGMECAIDPTNASVMYGEQYNGSINKSTNGGSSFSPIVSTGGTGVDEDGDWVTPYVIDPSNHNTLYVGKTQVYQSVNAGSSFTTLTSAPSAGNFVALAVAPSNGNYVYAGKVAELWMSSNASTFTQVTTPCGSLTYLCVDPQNPQRVWATNGGYNAGLKVFYSANAGSTWTNISGNLPNLPANCIVYEPGSNDGLYVGTDIGVYYKNNSLSNWIFYSNGLPNVIVHEMEFQLSTMKLRAATYGRGLWEIDPYTPPANPPAAAFSSNKTTVCLGNSVNFYDNSTNLPSTWNWTFTGGTPAASTNQSPTVTYPTPGVYPVKLVVTNNAGADSTTISSYITVLSSPTVTTSSDTTICRGDTVQLNASGGSQYVWNPSTWLTNSYISNPKAVPLSTKIYTVTVSDLNGCSTNKNVKVNVIPLPNTPQVYQNTDSVCVYPNTGVHIQWMLNGNPLPNDTLPCLYPTQNGNYTAQITDTSRCQYVLTAPVLSVNWVGIQSYGTGGGIELFPNPALAGTSLSMKFASAAHYQVKVYSAAGQEVFEQELQAMPGTVYQLKTRLSAGVYSMRIVDNSNKQLHIRKLTIVE